jgi:hypothetical protein
MSFNKHKKRIRHALVGWECVGFFGYGHGRALRVFGEEVLCGRSVCVDICNNTAVCRKVHHDRMDYRYPQLAQITGNALKVAKLNKTDPVTEIICAMRRSVELGLDEALEVKAIIEQFGVDSMTDHYQAGQFENIQSGLSGRLQNQAEAVPEEIDKAS